MLELLREMGFNPHYVKIAARHVQGGYFDLRAIHAPTNTQVVESRKPRIDFGL